MTPSARARHRAKMRKDIIECLTILVNLGHQPRNIPYPRTRRARYWFKWNGVVPGTKEARTLRRQTRAGLGRGSSRDMNYAYECRFKQKTLGTFEEFFRGCGLAKERPKDRRRRK